MTSDTQNGADAANYGLWRTSPPQERSVSWKTSSDDRSVWFDYLPDEDLILEVCIGDGGIVRYRLNHGLLIDGIVIS